MRWMMGIQRYLRNSVARNVEERCILNTIKGYMIMNIESRIGIRVKESGDSVRVGKVMGCLKSCCYNKINSIEHDFNRRWRPIPFPSQAQKYGLAHQRTPQGGAYELYAISSSSYWVRAGPCSRWGRCTVGLH
jgi:hypothetical protein